MYENREGDYQSQSKRVLMSLKKKIIILLVILVFGSGFGALTYTTINLRNKLRSEAERYAIAITSMLARMSAASQTVIKDVESILEDQMIAQAKITAHMVAAAEKAGESNEAIRNRLKEISKTTEVDEFWITNPKGQAYLTNVDGVDFSFSPDPKKQPQAHIFYDLLRKEGAENVTQEARVREIDNSKFKYVGTRGVDKTRIVQVGYDFEFMANLEEKIGLRRMIDAIVKDKRIDSIWVVDKNLSTLAHGSTPNENGATDKPQGDNDKSLASKEKSSDLSHSHRNKTRLSKAIKSGQIEASFETNYINVTAPILGANGQVLGATLIHFPTVALRDLLNNTAMDAFWLGVLALLIALSIAIIVGDKLSRPILALTASVRALYQGKLELEATEPFTHRTDELGVFVREFRRMATDIHQREEELDRLVKERTAALESAQGQIQKEVDMASRFQLAIMPSAFPKHENFNGKGFMRPAKEMGGDFYDVFNIDENRIGLVMADVSGKGVPSAFFMTMARTEIRNEAMGGNPPSEVLSCVNNRLCGENPLDLFVTVFYAIFNHSNGHLTYANGGHNPPYILRADKSIETIPLTGDLVVGMIEDIKFKNKTLTLQPKDNLFLYTDGICEAFNEKNEEFTNKRMEMVFKDRWSLDPNKNIEQMLSEVDNHVGEAPQSDDITCMSLQYLGNNNKNNKKEKTLMEEKEEIKSNHVARVSTQI